ncbi:Oidioi.mRNA.OKI2018_I69.chr1.g575.t1.cds [Oikopleura dioica]|uniref:Oidioi.mRNA.OKI2018_I69.chr1.g575.t1.cds n=1 Tax=Oikopleura dioica TaxID=34765 RepID=A0ABN7SNY9_OIKDI|nr:Oidioi.mRNA.OKI2018_I69.chr1.g575.t1.cds [Oikopleura dioica]
MKIFSIFYSFVLKRSLADFLDCGFVREFTDEENSVEISSPIHSYFFGNSTTEIVTYPRSAFCEWIFQDKCADGFFVDPLRFDVKSHKKCYFDKLVITNEDQSFNEIYCNQKLEHGTIETFDRRVYVRGTKIKIIFESDVFGQTNEGFQLRVTSKKADEYCRISDHEPICIWPYKEDSIYSKSFEKQTGVDLPDFQKRCAASCRDTPGCFKFKIEEDHSCQLRGSIMEDRNDESYAINGQDCSEPSNILWKDYGTVAKIFCRFGGIDEANEYIDFLREKNGHFIDWNTAQYADGWRITKKWTVNHVTDRKNKPHKIWYKFVSTIYTRKYLEPTRRSSDSLSSTQNEEDERKVLAQTNKEIQNFIENLNIGPGVEVLETEISDIKVERLVAMEDSPSNRLIEAFSKLGNFIEENSVKNQKLKIKQFNRVADKFSWFYDHSSEICKNKTVALFGTKKLRSPNIDDEDICRSFASLINSTMEFYDHHVCLDKIEADRMAKRRNRNIKSDIRRSKKIFNRFLTALECSERLPVA